MPAHAAIAAETPCLCGRPARTNTGHDSVQTLICPASVHLCADRDETCSRDGCVPRNGVCGIPSQAAGERMFPPSRVAALRDVSYAPNRERELM